VVGAEQAWDQSFRWKATAGGSPWETVRSAEPVPESAVAEQRGNVTPPSNYPATEDGRIQ
jgi:hypothetical protein